MASFSLTSVSIQRALDKTLSSYSNIKESATDEDLYGLALAFNKLTDKIIKSNRKIVKEEVLN